VCGNRVTRLLMTMSVHRSPRFLTQACCKQRPRPCGRTRSPVLLRSSASRRTDARVAEKSQTNGRATTAAAVSDAHANNNASRNLRTVGSTHAPTRCAAQASNECIVTEGPRRQHLSPKEARWRGQIRSTCPRTADRKPMLWIRQRVQGSALHCSQPRILVSERCGDRSAFSGHSKSTPPATNFVVFQ
jgi:hypothetical protein